MTKKIDQLKNVVVASTLKKKVYNVTHFRKPKQLEIKIIRHDILQYIQVKHSCIFFISM